MPKSALIVLIIGIIILAIASLFIFHLTDGLLPAKNAEPVKKAEPAKKMDNQKNTSGLKIEDLKIGEGREVQSGDYITIHYNGTLTDGTKFDSSYDRGTPFETRIGVGRVIKGWDEGVIGMKVGGKRKLTIPPDLGYGAQSVGSIPANSTLIFEVELIEIK